MKQGASYQIMYLEFDHSNNMQNCIMVLDNKLVHLDSIPPVLVFNRIIKVLRQASENSSIGISIHRVL